jgi:DNA-binding response OmpR family regulator
VTHILLIESDIENAKMVEQSFRKSKYRISRMRPEDATFEKVRNPQHNLVIIDIHPNQPQTLELISQLRHSELPLPVLVLCPQQAVLSILPHMTANEMDFLLKPVSMVEMKARAKTLLRKTSGLFENFHLKSAGVMLDLISRQVYREDTLISLQNNEFELLEFLMRNAGRVITKTEILEKVWNYSFDPQTNIVDVLVWRLRSKVDRHFSSKLIQTVRGVGYTFRPI